MKNKEIEIPPVGELFTYVRKKLTLKQPKMAAKLEMSVRSYRMYETGSYDDRDKNTATVEEVIARVEKMYKEIKGFPNQGGEEQGVIESIALLSLEIKQIKEVLLSTIERQSKTIDSLTNKIK